MKRTVADDVEMAGDDRYQVADTDPIEPDWHDVSLILAMLELTPLERIRKGEEMARQARAFRDAVGNQLQ